ncbi:hypothetical protein GP486_008397, partial [Trichoglossum hirsutum]
EEQKQIRKNLREYSKVFDEEDQYELDTANLAIVEQRRRALDEWLAWRDLVESELREERKALGLPEDPMEDTDAKVTEDAVVEEIIEEIVEETEEIIS